MTQPAPSHLADPGSLQNAVQEVIRNNSALGYNPARFDGATHGGSHPDLLKVCEGLITGPNAFAAMERAVRDFPGFLTLEDYVMRWGSEWGFTSAAMEHAKASADTFDLVVGRQRWAADGETPVA